MFPSNFNGSDVICDPTKFYYYNSRSGDIYCKQSEKALYWLIDDEYLSDKYDDWWGSKIIWSFFFLLTDWDYNWGFTAIGIDKEWIYYHFCWSDSVCFSLNPEILQKNAKKNQKVIKILAISNWFFHSYDEFQKKWENIKEFLRDRKELWDSLWLEMVI